MSEAKLEIKSELNKVIEQLQKLSAAGAEVSDGLKIAGNDVGESLEKQTKKVETFFGKLNSVGRRTADQLRGSFKSLAAINSLSGALKLSSQFSGSIKETIGLSDAIRKLGGSFGIAQKDFAALQSDLTKGMGEIGMSSEEAGDTIKGLAGTGVQGGDSLKNYSMKSAQLASLGGEKGKSGDIAGLLAGVVRAQGKNVNDPKAMDEVARAVTKAMEGTGKGASELLGHMQATFETMTSEQRKKTSASGLSSLAVAESVAGPQASAAIQKYLSMSKNEKAGLDAQGFSKIFKKDGGIDVQGLKQFAKDMKERGMDMRGNAQSMGFSSEEAEGLVRLTESADLLDGALKRTAKASDDINKKTRKNMGLQEAFQANVNKVKSMVAGPLSQATQGITDLLSGASESKGGAGAVVAGGGILAALMAGGGLKGIGGGMMKEATIGEAKKKALESLTGEKIQDVRVTNFDEMGGAGGGAAAGGGMGGRLAKAGGVIAAAGAVAELGNMYLSQPAGKGAVPGQDDSSKWDALFYNLSKAVGGSSSKAIDKAQKVIVEINDPRLKATKKTTRGASVAPTR